VTQRDAVTGAVCDASSAPEQRVGNDSVAVREVLGAAVGCTLFTLRVLRCVRGRSMLRETGVADELLFVLEGQGTLLADERRWELEGESGVQLLAGSRYELENEHAEDLVLVAVALHEPLAAPEGTAPTTLSRLADAQAQSATAARTFRIVFDPDGGCATATQFVGYIPVGAAPTHYHLYDEVIYVLDGNGVMHFNDEQIPLRAGSCIHLPARKLHTLENSGPAVMRVLGVFRPAGSPAEAYYPDGSPAYADEPATAAASR
jgi:mannose-6-phosphate isomerase-like protein (cupin superfamily)